MLFQISHIIRERRIIRNICFLSHLRCRCIRRIFLIGSRIVRTLCTAFVRLRTVCTGYAACVCRGCILAHVSHGFICSGCTAHILRGFVLPGCTAVICHRFVLTGRTAVIRHRFVLTGRTAVIRHRFVLTGRTAVIRHRFVHTRIVTISGFIPDNCILISLRVRIKFGCLLHEQRSAAQFRIHFFSVSLIESIL